MRPPQWGQIRPPFPISPAWASRHPPRAVCPSYAASRSTGQRVRGSPPGRPLSAAVSVLLQIALVSNSHGPGCRTSYTARGRVRPYPRERGMGAARGVKKSALAASRLERERERERCVRQLTHLVTRPPEAVHRTDTFLPPETTLRHLPHRSDQAPLPQQTSCERA